MIRKDKTKDRVEISSEKLSESLTEAENMGMRVIGWCHSHPHITRWPSHVDLGTQKNFQTMDSRFFGLIYSVFNETVEGTQNIQVTAFQTAEPCSHQLVPLCIVPSKLNHREFLKFSQIARKLLEEEMEVVSYTLARPTICSLRMAQLQDKFILPLIHALRHHSSHS